MKKTISLLLAMLMIAALAMPAGAANFDLDNGIALKAPFISKSNTSHPDTTKVFDLNTKTIGVFAYSGNSKYTHMNSVQWIDGRSGAEGDYAAYLKSKTNDAFTNTTTLDTGDQLYLVHDTTLKDTISDWQGDQIVEFDVKADNTSGRLGFMMWHLWTSGYDILTEDGKVNGTLYTYPIGEWFHIKMVFNNHVWNVYATDSEGVHHIVKNVDAISKSKPSNTWSQGSRMAFLFSQPNGVTNEEDRMGYALDNIHIYRTYNDDGTNDISKYMSASYAESDGTAADSLSSNGKLLLNFGNITDSSLFNIENIVLEESDGTVVSYDATYENGVYTVDPKRDLIQAEKYKLKISDEVRKMLNPDLPPTGSFYVVVRDDRPLIISNFISKGVAAAGENFAVDVTVANKNSDSQKVGIVICIYDESGSLKAISRKNFDAANGETTEKASLIVPDDYDETFGIKIYLTTGYGIRILDEKNI